jgi:Ca2+-transporting ATPase
MPMAHSAAQADFPVVVSLVHAAGSGRVRLHVQGLYRSDRLKSELEKALSHHAMIQEARANCLTGNLLVQFTPDQDQNAVIKEVDKVARRCLNGRIVSIPKPKPHPFIAKPARAKPKSPGESSFFGGRFNFPFGKAKASVEAMPSQPVPQHAWHRLDTREAMERLDTSKVGLSVVEAGHRLQIYGPNRLAENQRRSTLQIFAEQIANPAMALLGVSAVVSVATGGLIDAVVIVSAVLMNAVIGYVTENSSERTINALGSMAPTHAHVIRDGKQLTIPIEEIVIGDLLVLTPGSYVPADARLLNSSRLTVDESTLTGESMPVGKHWDFIAPEDTPLADRKNMLHMGTIVTGGSGQALVAATGRNTEIGLIQSLVGEVKPPETLLQQQLDGLNKNLATVCGVLCVGVFGLGVLRGYTWLQMLSSSISLAVAAIPEGLPAVATTTLAIGIRNSHREKVLIRQLGAVESLGSVQVICLDKTGTLTLNKMKTVSMRTAAHSVALVDDRFEVKGRAIVALEQPEIKRLLETVCLCSEVKFSGCGATPELEGSPTENAMIEAALNAGADVRALRATYPLIKTTHRAENRPYMMTVHETAEGGLLFAVKGSPADVLSLCQWRQHDGELEALDDSIRDRIIERNDRLAGDALRVLGVAYAAAAKAEDLKAPPLVWLGLIGMEDSIRPDMDRLMAEFHDAGVRTVMITGDQSATAYSVGSRLGLSGDAPLEIIDSANLDKLDPEILKGVINNTSVFARVSPAHKLRIVQALQEAGHVVAMTGDGVNDGPALKAADIGVAMGDQGTDVARSVADVVLEDDNLHTMIIAIRQGRTIYSNIRKSLRFLLSTNLSEIELAVLTMAFGMGEALNPLQLLWINMVADIAPAMALALEPPERDVLKQPPRDPGRAIINGPDFRRLLRESLFITGGSLSVYSLSRLRYGPGLQASSNTFLAFTLAKFLHALSCRSEDTTVLDRDRPANPHMVTALGGTLAIQALATFVPQLRGLLRCTPLALVDLPLIMAGASIPFVLNEFAKRIDQNMSKNVDPSL